MARAEQALGNELGPAGQALAGRVLRRKGQPKKEEEDYRPTLPERAADVGGKLISHETRAEAEQYGEALGEYLSREIAEGKFTGFVFALILAILKDFVADPVSAFVKTIPGAGIPLGLLFDWVIIPAVITTPLTIIVILLQPSRFKRWFIKRHLAKYLASVVVGVIPGLKVLPEATVAVILIKISADRRRRKLQRELEEVNRETARMKK